MMRYLIALFLLFFVPLFWTDASRATQPEKCELAVPCQLNQRSFHARLPDGWDGKTPLPVLIHFHGWARQGSGVMKNPRVAGAARKLGVLLLAPNGQRRTWNFWHEDTEDVPFTDAMIEEAAKRWPIDRGRIFVSGYSYGSAMAWRFACNGATNINTLLAMSGTLESEENCNRPVNIRHIHGTRDTVMDYPFGADGDVEGAVALWRNRNGCNGKADQKTKWQTVKILPILRHSWNTCSSGKSVILDVHKRGHFIPRFWIARQLEDLL